MLLCLSAQAEPSCDYQDSAILGHRVKWCAERSRPDIAPEAGEPVVYFMHGIFGGARNWVSDGYSAALDKMRIAKVPAVTFVSFDTSAMSFFSDEGDRHWGPGAYETWLIEEFMPYIEGRFNLCHERDCRALAGVSMGGYGALKTALRHPKLFGHVAVNSPALGPFGLFESDRAWWNYFNEHSIGGVRGMPLLYQLRRVQPTPQVAEANDPIWLAAHLRHRSDMPALYLDVGDHDDFGFEVGFARFNAILDSRGLRHESHLVSGNHSVSNVRNIYALAFLFSKLGGERRLLENLF